MKEKRIYSNNCHLLQFHIITLHYYTIDYKNDILNNDEIYSVTFLNYFYRFILKLNYVYI